MKILILVGSADNNSHSLHLGQAIATNFQQKNAEPQLINLVEYGLPSFDRSVERAGNYDQKTAEFLKLSKEADSYVWVTPIYHNSFSSVLKTALDWQHFFMDGKVVGMASNGGNRSTAAVDQLMIVARSQRLITSPVRVCTSEEDYDESLNITSEAINQRINEFTDRLMDLASKIAK